MEAALELLGEPGRSDLIVTEVVERAGVSLRTFYQRFGGKDEFMLAALEESLLHARELTKDAMGDEQDPVERLTHPSPSAHADQSGSSMSTSPIASVDPSWLLISIRIVTSHESSASSRVFPVTSPSR